MPPDIALDAIPEIVIDLIDRAARAALGRRRADGSGGAFGDRQRDLRRTGTRMRSVPFTPDKVLAALKA